MCCLFFFVFSSRRRHTRCALVTGVQTCALPIFPRIDLLDLKPRAREEEGRGEIGPDRITAEIDDVLAVPRRRHLVIGEGGPGRRPFADKLAVVSYDRRAVGLVETALPGGGAGSVLDMLMLRSEEHTSEVKSLMGTSYAVFCLK